MCYVIDSENILLNYFYMNKESREITFDNLRNIRKRIENQLDNSVYIDITYKSIQEAVSQHNELLDIELTKIILKEDSPKYIEKNFLEKKINNKLPEIIKEQYLSILNE